VLESDSDSDANDSDFESDESGVVNDVESSSEGDVDLFRDFGWHRGKREYKQGVWQRRG